MIAHDLDALALALIKCPADARHVMAVAVRLTALAARLHQQEATVGPPHLRTVPPDLPSDVAKLCGRRARI